MNEVDLSTEAEIESRVQEFRDKIEGQRKSRESIPREPPQIVRSVKTLETKVDFPVPTELIEEKRKKTPGQDQCLCNGEVVWSDNNPSGAPPKSVDVTITLPWCTESWTYSFAPHTSADLFEVNNVVYSPCTPLFGSGGADLPVATGTVSTATSGYVLHIVIQGACGGNRRSSWVGSIVCNSSVG